MKTILSTLLISLILGSQTLFAQPTEIQLKPRVVVLTDVSTWETDDTESLVRFLVHADLYEIEGIVWTTGYSHSNISSNPTHFEIIHGVIDAYEQDLPNLLKRSNQSGHEQENSPQEIGYWPSADYVREHTMKGSIRRGQQYIGANNNSDGSKLIIDLADEDDDRPIWITVWGGANTLAQAIWQVQQTRSEDELEAFLHKLRVYTITDQDRHYDGSEGYEVSSHQWMRREFEEDLFFIWDECAWKFQNGTGASNWSQYETHIQGHGNLGGQYPKYKFGVEGDTPAFLHILPNGLNNPETPAQCGWGGYSEWGLSADNQTYAYTNPSGTANRVCTKYENRFYAATFNNFAARMDWAKDGTGNRNPVLVVDGDEGLFILTRTPKEGSAVMLDASGTYDADGDALTFKWWIQQEAGSYSSKVTILNSDSSAATVNVPSGSEGESFHVICEVTDNGTHNLSSYRRIIFEPVVNTDPGWVATWSTAPYAAENNTPPSPYLANNTLRQIVRVSIGGDTLRVKFSNRTCSTPVTMNSVNIAVSTDASKSLIETSTKKQLTFNGKTSVTMNAYSEVTSDPLAFPLTPSTHLAITIYYGQCETSSDMTFHYGSRTNSYILAGDQTASADFSGAKKVERWYNLSSIDVLAPRESAAVAVLGNSITDGYGIHDGKNKWPDTFSEKLLDNPATSHVSVLNLGIGATLVTTSGVSRFQQDILAQAGLRWIVIFYGVNDIGADKSAADVINAFRTLISQAHAQNIRIYGATITPFKGHSYYSAARETVRIEVNEWIRTPGNFDKCIDFDEAIRNPSDAEKLQAAYSNDWLHPNAAGYKLLGESVDINLFLGADTTFEQPDMSGIETFYFEAECGPIGSNWDIIKDAGASNGSYISVKSGIQSLNAAAAGSENTIDFPFSITNESTYTIYARLNCPTYDDDSFWVKMDNGAFQMVNGLVTGGWQWLQLQSYNLTAGDHALTITYREDGAKLDKLCITNNIQSPAGIGEEAENLCDPTSVFNSTEMSERYALEQNYPNPFNPSTTVKYNLKNSGPVQIKIYNLNGQTIKTLVDGYQEKGAHEIVWQPKGLASGLYFCRLQVEDPSTGSPLQNTGQAGQRFSETKQLFLLK